MEIGIAGLPGCGKTTLFNALARAHAPVGGFSVQATANRSVIKVPDARLAPLVELFHPKSVKSAEVEFVDVAGLTRGAGQESQAAFLAQLRTVDALLLVVAAFAENTTVDRVESDLTSIQGELLLADLDVVDRRLERLDREVRMARGSDTERQVKARELEILRRVKEALEREAPARSLELSPDERHLLRGYALLTEKPILVVLNVGDDVQQGERLAADLASRAAIDAEDWIAIPGRLEMELTELDAAEAEEFMTALGITALSAGRVIEASYGALQLISFLTVGPDEVRAWPIPRGATALDAAGTIHSDIARGFIRAEVVPYEDLLAAGSLAEARKRGKLRTEGKGYVVQDGDIFHVLFNV
jgi:hypothetical protein